VKLGALLVFTLVVDRYGRKVLFMVDGVQMIIAQVRPVSTLNNHLPILEGRGCLDHGRANRQERRIGDGAVAVVAFTCLHGAGFGWSRGPMNWLVPSPVDIQPAGQAMNASLALGLIFVLTQSFLAMLCRFKYATFAYYAAWVAVMTVFVAVFLPETKGVPLESMGTIWVKHWYWKRFVQGHGTNAVALALT